MCVRMAIATHTNVMVGITHGVLKKLSTLSSLYHRVATKLVPIARRKIIMRRMIGHNLNCVVRATIVSISMKRIVQPAAM